MEKESVFGWIEEVDLEHKKYLVRTTSVEVRTKLFFQ